MKVIIELDNLKGLSGRHTVTIKDGLRGNKVLKAIEKEIRKNKNLDGLIWKFISIVPGDQMG